MKSDLFSKAISDRNRVKFLYGFNEVVLEPYYIAFNKIGKKVIYGRISSTNEIKMFEYEKIMNIKILEYNKFSPIIPIMSFN